MQKFSFIIVLLCCTLLFSNSVNGELPKRPTTENIYLFQKKRNDKTTNRCPAMPIYGTYDGYTLSIDVVADDEAATYELVVTTAGTQTVGQYTAVELNQGVAVPPLQPATIELTTPSGAVYVGEITN